MAKDLLARIKKKHARLELKLKKAQLRAQKITNIINATAKIMEHLPKAVDVSVNIGLAYIGAKMARHWSGALYGPVALKLAQSPNIASGVAGVTGLAALGILAAQPKEQIKALVEEYSGIFVPAAPATEREKAIIDKVTAGELLTAEEEAYLKQRAMTRWVW